MSRPEITLEEDPEVADEISTALQRWNESQVGPRRTQRLTLTIRGADGELLGGLVGEFFWTFLYVADLWIADRYRGRGFGQALLGRAEELAAARGCSVAFLSTMTFQAPGFYEKCGYAAFGSLPYAPAPLGRTWFAKALGEGVSVQ